MSTISLRLDDRDSELIKNYARVTHTSVTELVRNAVISKIEDEIDVHLFDEALKQMQRTYSLEEVKAELGL